MCFLLLTETLSELHQIYRRENHVNEKMGTKIACAIAFLCVVLLNFFGCFSYSLWHFLSFFWKHTPHLPSDIVFKWLHVSQDPSLLKGTTHLTQRRRKDDVKTSFWSQRSPKLVWNGSCDEAFLRRRQDVLQETSSRRLLQDVLKTSSRTRPQDIFQETSSRRLPWDVLKMSSMRHPQDLKTPEDFKTFSGK